MRPVAETLETAAFRDRLRDLEDDVTLERPAPLVVRRPFNPRRMLALTFGALIFVGTFLLCTPWAQASGMWAWERAGVPFDWGFAWRQLIDQLFMATSAVCVTGLGLFDLSKYYTAFGQGVILLCIQLGGLGIMTLGTFLMTLLLGRLPTDGERQVMLFYGANSSAKARQLLLKTIQYVFVFEFFGALLLFVRYHWHHGYAIGKSVWYAAFHSISAFCNAGFSLHSNNLMDIRGDWPYALVIGLLVLLGGIGFLVLANLSQYRFWRHDLRRRGRISLHSRLVLWATLGLVVIGGALFTAFEWNGALGENFGPSAWELMSEGNWTEALKVMECYWAKLCEGFSQAIMYRTAGFNFVDMGETSQPTNFVGILMMLVGGSPGSMAGGLKTTTVIVLFLTMRAMIQGNPEVQVHRRTIPAAVCREAMVVVFFYIMMLFAFYFVLLLSERPFLAQRGELALFYEVTSAFGTVGSSLNATPLLTPWGRLIICLAMYLGRLGPISVALIVAGREPSRRIRYPEESVTVG